MWFPGKSFVFLLLASIPIGAIATWSPPDVLLADDNVPMVWRTSDIGPAAPAEHLLSNGSLPLPDGPVAWKDDAARTNRNPDGARIVSWYTPENDR